MFVKIFNTFYNAIANEICVDNNILKRLNKNHLKFTPVRSILTVDLVEKYKINLFLYSILCILFVLFSFLYFLIKLFKNLEINGSNQNIKLNENVILVANSRVDYLYKKLNLKEKVTYININQLPKTNYISYKQFLNSSDYLLAFIFSVVSVFYLLYKLKNKTDILQAYVVYDWALVYISLSKVKKGVKKVYFANHYDRWAVMFDQLFKDKEVVLIQHGILPDDLQLEYKLKNLRTIYYYNKKSKVLFEKMFNINNVKFEKLNLSLNLSNIGSTKKSILVIGQPHVIDKEIDIINALKKKYKDIYVIYIKPHPLYSFKKYKSIKDVTVIEDRDFYPKVDLALCYESTLGLEYEASNVNVLWWKNMNLNQIIKEIEKIVRNNWI